MTASNESNQGLVLALANVAEKCGKTHQAYNQFIEGKPLDLNEVRLWMEVNIRDVEQAIKELHRQADSPQEQRSLLDRMRGRCT
ncbi:MAG: hypothetical protein ACTHJW_13405 [Streptosporangiaceae bacterium]